MRLGRLMGARRDKVDGSQGAWEQKTHVWVSSWNKEGRVVEGRIIPKVAIVVATRAVGSPHPVWFRWPSRWLLPWR